MTSPFEQMTIPNGVRDLVYDAATPASSRICDYLLGGAANFAADQAAAEQLLRVMPAAALDARANRAFRRRALRYLLHRGVRQFLDLGAGIPIPFDTVHEVVHACDPFAQVIYVDCDPLVAEHAQCVLADVPVGVVHADLCSPDAVFGNATVFNRLDLNQPVGLLMTAVGHFVPDGDNLSGILAVYRSMLPPGSFLVLSHATAAELTPEEALGAIEVYERTATPLTLRTPEQIARLFDGYVLLLPGDDAQPAVVRVGEWRWGDDLNKAPDDRACAIHGGVGYLPG